MENKLFLFILFFFNNIFKGELPDQFYIILKGKVNIFLPKS